MLVDQHLLAIRFSQHDKVVVAENEGIVDLVTVGYVDGDRNTIPAGSVQKRIL